MTNYAPYQPTQLPSAPQPQPPRRPRRWPWIGGGILAVIAAAAVGNATANERTGAVKTIVVTHTVTVTASPVTSVITQVVTVTPPPPPGPATTIQNNGVYVVGSDMAAGTWHTTGGAQCYYAKLASTNTSDIQDNNNITGTATVTIGSSTKAFEIDGGCTWTKE